MQMTIMDEGAISAQLESKLDPYWAFDHPEKEHQIKKCLHSIWLPLSNLAMDLEYLRPIFG